MEIAGSNNLCFALTSELFYKDKRRQRKARSIRENDWPLGPHESKSGPEDEARDGKTIHPCGDGFGVSGANDLPDLRYEAANGTYGGEISNDERCIQNFELLLTAPFKDRELSLAVVVPKRPLR